MKTCHGSALAIPTNCSGPWKSSPSSTAPKWPPSLYRKESRWGLYHYRVDYPDQNDAEWFYHSRLFKDENGQMASGKRPIADYLVSLGEEKDAYRKMRVQKAANG